MAQMKNIIFNFPKKEVSTPDGTYSIPDFTRNTIYQIADLDIAQDNNYVEYRVLENNQTIEALAQTLYNNADYWDLIIALNARNPLFDMTYVYDVIVDSNEKFINEYKTRVYGPYLPDSNLSYIRSWFLEEFEDRNEQNRIIKVAIPTRLQEFMKTLRDLGFAKSE